MTKVRDCEFCGLSLDDLTEPAHFEWATAYHDRCKGIFDGYRHFQTVHDGMCHLPDCPEGEVRAAWIVKS